MIVCLNDIKYLLSLLPWEHSAGQHNASKMLYTNKTNKYTKAHRPTRNYARTQLAVRLSEQATDT